MMYMITFRARNPESGPEVVEKIDRSIKALGPKSAGFFENVWMVETNLHSSNIRDLLREHINPGDRLFVSQLAAVQNWAGINMGDQFPDWLKDRNFEAPNR